MPSMNTPVSSRVALRGLRLGTWALAGALGLSTAHAMAPDAGQAPAPVSIAPAATAKPRTQVSGDATLAGDASGRLALKLGKPSGRASVVFDYPAGGLLDLSAFRDTVVTAKNQAGAEVEVNITVLSDLEQQWRYGTTGRYFVRPDESTELHVFMPRPALPATHPHVKALGNLYAFPWGHQRHWTGPKVEAIKRVAVRLAWHGARADEVFELGLPQGGGNFSTDPELLSSYPPPWLDALGQATDRDWPGKMKDAAELQADAEKDRALIASVTGPRPGLSRFGGLLDGPRREATGFFRVEKIDGKWWFVDPEGHLFWSVGVNTAGTMPETRVTGREAYFPESVRGEAEVRFYGLNVQKKFGGEDWVDRHAALTAARMLDWGLNTVGAWSLPQMNTPGRVPYTLIVHTEKTGLGSVGKIPDPFSDAFKKSLHSQLEKVAAVHANSPWMVGVFIHNELEWNGGNHLAEQVLGTAKRTPAREALEKLLTERHGSIEKLNEAWGTKFESFAAARTRPAAGAPEAYTRDLTDFMTQIADTYFAVCRAAMDRYLPNHLYLGCRFNTFNPIVTAASSRYCDVVSANLYRHTVADFSMASDADKPLLIGEFHFGIRDYGPWGVGLTWAADARNQADLYHAYMSDALRHPNIVGAHWFQWADQVATGRRDGENFGVGLVSVVDRPTPTLVEAIRDVTSQLYAYRLKPAPTRIGAPAPR